MFSYKGMESVAQTYTILRLIQLSWWTTGFWPCYAYLVKGFMSIPHWCNSFLQSLEAATLLLWMSDLETIFSWTIVADELYIWESEIPSLTYRSPCKFIHRTRFDPNNWFPRCSEPLVAPVGLNSPSGIISHRQLTELLNSTPKSAPA